MVQRHLGFVQLLPRWPLLKRHYWPCVEPIAKHHQQLLSPSPSLWCQDCNETPTKADDHETPPLDSKGVSSTSPPLVSNGIDPIQTFMINFIKVGRMKKQGTEGVKKTGFGCSNIHASGGAYSSPMNCIIPSYVLLLSVHDSGI